MTARAVAGQYDDYRRRAADANRRARARRKAGSHAAYRTRQLERAIAADVAAHLIPGATPDQRANLHVLARAVRTEIAS